MRGKLPASYPGELKTINTGDDYDVSGIELKRALKLHFPNNVGAP